MAEPGPIGTSSRPIKKFECRENWPIESCNDDESQIPDEATNSRSDEVQESVQSELVSAIFRSNREDSV